jgi:hypothetical protein
MNTLKDRLDRIRDGFQKEAPPQALAVMARAHQELADSGIMDRIPTVGDKLTAFSLPDTEGNTVASDKLLAEGPLVVTSYRGVW